MDEKLKELHQLAVDYYPGTPKDYNQFVGWLPDNKEAVISELSSVYYGFDANRYQDALKKKGSSVSTSPSLPGASTAGGVQTPKAPAQPRPQQRSSGLNTLLQGTANSQGSPLAGRTPAPAAQAQPQRQATPQFTPDPGQATTDTEVKEWMRSITPSAPAQGQPQERSPEDEAAMAELNRMKGLDAQGVPESLSGMGVIERIVKGEQPPDGTQVPLQEQFRPAQLDGNADMSPDSFSPMVDDYFQWRERVKELGSSDPLEAYVSSLARKYAEDNPRLARRLDPNGDIKMSPLSLTGVLPLLTDEQKQEYQKAWDDWMFMKRVERDPLEAYVQEATPSEGRTNIRQSNQKLLKQAIQAEEYKREVFDPKYEEYKREELPEELKGVNTDINQYIELRDSINAEYMPQLEAAATEQEFAALLQTIEQVHKELAANYGGIINEQGYFEFLPEVEEAYTRASQRAAEEVYGSQEPIERKKHVLPFMQDVINDPRKLGVGGGAALVVGAIPAAFATAYALGAETFLHDTAMGRGVTRAVIGMAADAQALVAMNTKNEERQERLLAKRRYLQRVAAGWIDDNDVMDLFEVRSVADGVNYVGTQLGQMAPIVGMFMLSGHVGGITAGAAATMLRATPAVIRTMAIAGSYTGSFTSGVALYGAGIYGDLREGGATHQEARTAAMMYAPVASAASIVVPATMVNIMAGHFGKQWVAGGMKNILRTAGLGSFEGPAELLAELSVIYAEQSVFGRKHTSEEITSRLTNAMVAGLMMGWTMGGAAGVSQGRQKSKLIDLIDGYVAHGDQVAQSMPRPDIANYMLEMMQRVEDPTPDQQKFMRWLQNEYAELGVYADLEAEGRPTNKAVRDVASLVDKFAIEAMKRSQEDNVKRISELTERMIENDGAVSMEEGVELTALLANAPNAASSVMIPLAGQQSMMEMMSREAKVEGFDAEAFKKDPVKYYEQQLQQLYNEAGGDMGAIDKGALKTLQENIGEAFYTMQALGMNPVTSKVDIEMVISFQDKGVSMSAEVTPLRMKLNQAYQATDQAKPSINQQKKGVQDDTSTQDVDPGKQDPGAHEAGQGDTQGKPGFPEAVKTEVVGKEQAGVSKEAPVVAETKAPAEAPIKSAQAPKEAAKTEVTPTGKPKTLINKIKNYATEVISNRKEVRRLSQEAEQGRKRGGIRNVEASILLITGKEGDGPIKGREAQQQAIEEYAKSEGIWFENISDSPEIGSSSEGLGVYVDSGVENMVYIPEDNPNIVRKAMRTTDPFNKNNENEVLYHLDTRISEHNAGIGSSVPYTVVGFGKLANGDFVVITEQPRVKAARLATRAEIAAEMGKMGYEADGKDAYSNENHSIADVNPKNVLVDEAGNLHFIDTLYDVYEVNESDGFQVDSKTTATTEKAEVSPEVQQARNVVAKRAEHLGVTRNKIKKSQSEALKNKEYKAEHDNYLESIQELKDAEKELPADQKSDYAAMEALQVKPEDALTVQSKEAVAKIGNALEGLMASKGFIKKLSGDEKAQFKQHMKDLIDGVVELLTAEAKKAGKRVRITADKIIEGITKQMTEKGVVLPVEVQKIIEDQIRKSEKKKKEARRKERVKNRIPEKIEATKKEGNEIWNSAVDKFKAQLDEGVSFGNAIKKAIEQTKSENTVIVETKDGKKMYGKNLFTDTMATEFQETMGKIRTAEEVRSLRGVVTQVRQIVTRAVKEAGRLATNEYSNNITKLADYVQSKINSGIISKNNGDILIRQIRDAAKLTSEKGREKALRKIEQTISEINDPWVKQQMKGLSDRLNNMVQTEKTKTLAPGKKVQFGVKTTEFASRIKTLRDVLELIKADEDANATFEKIMVDLQNEYEQATTQQAKDEVLERMTAWDMGAKDAQAVQVILDMFDRFKNTKPTEHAWRAPIYEQAVKAINELAALEEASNKARQERRAQLEQEAEARKQRREKVLKASLTPIKRAKQEFLTRFDEDSNAHMKPVEEGEVTPENIDRSSEGVAKISVKKPTVEQIHKELADGNIVTFKYKNESDVPVQFRDRTSTSEVNGEKVIRVTMAKSEADYYLSQPESGKEKARVKDMPTTQQEALDFAYNNMLDAIANSTLSKNMKAKLKGIAEKIRKEHAKKPAKDQLNEKFAKNQLQALEKAFNMKAAPVDKQGNPVRRFSLNPIKMPLFENLRGLLDLMTNDRTMLEEMMELDRKADQAYSKHTQLERERVTVMASIKNAIRGIEQDATLMQKLIGKLVGSKESRAFYFKSSKLGVKENIYTNPDAKGDIRSVSTFDKLSLSDIVNISRLLKNQDNVAIVEKTYTPDSVQRIKDHADRIVSENVKLNMLVEQLNEAGEFIYKTTNEAYKRKFGTDMLKLEDWISRIAIRPERAARKGQVEKRSLMPGSIFNRTNRVREIRLIDVDVINMFDEASKAANKWNAYGEVNEQWNNVFFNTEVRRAIMENVEMGKSILTNLDRLYEIYPDGVQKKYGLQLIANMVMSKIMANPSLFPKQISSLPNSMTHFTRMIADEKGGGIRTMFAPLEYAGRMADFRSWGRFAKEFSKSSIVKQRLHRGFDPDQIAHAENAVLIDLIQKFSEQYASGTVSVFERMRAFNRMLKEIQAVPVKAGDIGAFMGIKPNYDLLFEKYSKTMDASEASQKAFEVAVMEGHRVQQPGAAPHLMSGFQTTWVGKMMPYQTAQIQMGQNAREGMRRMLDEASTPAQRISGAQQATYFGLIQPAMWYAVAKVFSSKAIALLMRGDSEEIERNWDAVKEDIFTKEQVISIILDGASQGIPPAKALKDAGYAKYEKLPWYGNMGTTVEMIAELRKKSIDVGDILVKKINNGEELSNYERNLMNAWIAELHGTLTGHGTPAIERIRRYHRELDLIVAQRTLEDLNNSKQLKDYKVELQPISSRVKIEGVDISPTIEQMATYNLRSVELMEEKIETFFNRYNSIARAGMEAKYIREYYKQQEIDTKYGKQIKKIDDTEIIRRGVEKEIQKLWKQAKQEAKEEVFKK
jgi:hypothetical protein